MLLYRIYPHLDGVAAQAPGGPFYLHKPQGHNRCDNPALYDAWYFALTPEAAVGEVFGNLRIWSEAMFALPVLAGARRVLGLYDIDETSTPLLDLDDASALLDRGLRPTQVVSRTYPVTQRWAAGIYRETDASGEPLWSGIRWWSFHRPHWAVVVLWSTPEVPVPAKFVRHESLSLDHPAVTDAARSLAKQVDLSGPRL